MIEYLKENKVPVIAYLEPTLRCNHACYHCYLEHGAASKGPELTLSEITGVLDSLVRLKTIFLIITGGEPFLRDDLLDIIAAARARHFAVVLFTNGSMITPSVARELYKHALLGVEISIHGVNAQMHDSVTAVPGSFDRAIRAVSLLVAQGVEVSIKCNLMKDNWGCYEEYIALAKGLGAHHRLNPQLACRRDGDKWPKQYLAERSSIKQILLDPLLRKGPVCFDKPSNLELGDNAACGAGQNVVAIGPTGEVSPCVPLQIRAGSVRTQSLESIWHTSELFKLLRQRKNRDLSACPTCELARFCFRCMATANTETGDLWGCPPTAREMAQLWQEIAEESSQGVCSAS